MSERARYEHRSRTLLHAMHRLRAFASRIGQGHAAAAVRLGHVPAEIRDYAANTGADLVVGHGSDEYEARADAFARARRLIDGNV